MSTANIYTWPDLYKKTLKLPALLLLGPLGWLENTFLPDYQMRYPPVFIIGAPRSGTTLLQQVITYALSTSYLTNLAMRLRVKGISRPPVVLAAWLAKRLGLIERRVNPFNSNYGHTHGWGNPGDSVMFWQHWFSDGYYTGAGELSSERQRSLYQAVAGVEKIFGHPFVDKTTDNSVRIRALVEVFPDALFIQTIRSPLAVAQSIYIGRIDEIEKGFPSSYTTFTKPKEFDAIRHKNLAEQACSLCFYIEQNIAEDKAVIPDDRFMTINYKSLCLNPQRELDRIFDFLNSHRSSVTQIRPLPETFPYSHVRQLDLPTYETLINHLEQLYNYEIERLDEKS